MNQQIVLALQQILTFNKLGQKIFGIFAWLNDLKD